MEWSEERELRHLPQSYLSLYHDKDGMQAHKWMQVNFILIYPSLCYILYHAIENRAKIEKSCCILDRITPSLPITLCIALIVLATFFFLWHGIHTHLKACVYTKNIYDMDLIFHGISLKSIVELISMTALDYIRTSLHICHYIKLHFLRWLW